MATVRGACSDIAVRSVVIFLLSTLTGASGYADEPALYFGNVTVLQATATAVPAGGYSVLRFKLINNGSQSLQFLGIETDLAEESKLMVHLGAEDWTTLESISVPSGEVLDLHSSHFYVLMGPLRRPLKEGDVFDAQLKLVSAEIPTLFHVHPSK